MQCHHLGECSELEISDVCLWCSVMLPDKPGICGHVLVDLEAVELRTNQYHVLNATSLAMC